MTTIISLKTRLTTRRLDETRDWYRDLFGLVVREQWNEPSDVGCILGLSADQGEAFIEIIDGEPNADWSGLSLQFRVDDVDLFPIPREDRFAHRGPVDRPWGSRYLIFTDPNGISVIIFSGSSL